MQDPLQSEPPPPPCGIDARSERCRDDADRRIGFVVLSDVRFLREGLAEVLARDETLALDGVAASIDEALKGLQSTTQVLLIDAALPDGLATVARLRRQIPGLRIAALALKETQAEVIAWAEAGVTGYVTRDTALADVAGLLKGILRGEQSCAPGVAAALLQRIAEAPRAGVRQPAAVEAATALTAREDQVVRLICEGLGNKAIARRLNIGLATTKSHVHNILRKTGAVDRAQVGCWARLHARDAALGSPRS